MSQPAIRAAFIALLCIFVGLQAGANEALSRRASSASKIRLASVSSVSKTFRAETRAAAQSIPDPVWQTIEQAGWRIHLAEFVVDAAPALRGVTPRGWPRHLTWENSDALHLPSSRLLVVAEKRRNRAGQVVRSSRVASVFRHELGHAFDMAVGGGQQFLSCSSRFVAAYNRDVSQLSNAQRERFAYYVQGPRAGWQETFAEAFAVSLGGGSSNVKPQEFQAAFPRVTRFVRTAIDNPRNAKATTQTVAAPATRRTLSRR
jgi:hypothetical protein